MDLSTKKIFKILSITTLFVFLIFLAYKISWVLGWILAAFIISTILNPITNLFQKIMPQKNRGLAVLATFLVLLLFLALFFLIILPPIANEVSGLGTQMNNWISSPEGSAKIEKLIGLAENQKNQINTSSIYSALKGASTTLASGLGGIISKISNGIFMIISILTLTFFMLLDNDGLLRGILYFVPRKYRPVIKKLHDDLFVLVSKYFAGVVFVALIAGIFAVIPLLILGIPYATVLAVIIGITSLIPMVGATIGGGVVIIFCLLSGNYFGAAIMTAYFIIYQQIENNVIIPLVQKRTVKMPPLAIIIALLVGGAVAGGFGTILAIPAAAFIKITFDTFNGKSIEQIQGIEE